MAGRSEWGKKDFAICLLLILTAALIFYIALLPPAACAGCNAKVALVFSPGAEGEVVSFIRSARESIDIEMYVFTSDAVARELGDAVKRGARVRVIMEPRVEDSRKQRMFDTLLALGVEARWASFSYKLTHSKFIVVDGKRALIGSINFSASALNYNRETAVEIDGEKVKEVAAAFEADWGMASAAATASGGTAAGE
ncbi:MAG: phospholipase D-like domain-containing protein [Candidatus Micrarchaeia archaeon]|jgi:phosphatidylserine/phosphatidylglycerophosphate/cardiolipin synthase-like enzyme